MNNNELRKGDHVEVVKGLWKGAKGTIEDVHKESSVVRFQDAHGETGYALKEDVRRVEVTKTAK